MNVGRKLGGVSRAELERRWTLVRDRLRERDADALVVVGIDNELSGTVRWLTDAPVTYRKVVVFFAVDLMTVVEHGAAGRERELDGTDPDYPGVGRVLTVSEFSSVHYTQAYEAQPVAELLRRHGCKRVALSGPLSMPAGFHRVLTTTLGTVDFIDETDFIDRCKALKSAEEIALLREAAAMQDEIFTGTLAQLRPGMRDFEVSALAAYEARRRGGDHGILLCGSAPHGEPAFIRGTDQQGRTIETGDSFTLLVENGSPAGLFLELGRTVCFGPPQPEIFDAVALARDAQAYTLAQMKPGVACRDIYAAHNAYMTAHGSFPEARIYAHGQGYDLMERPLMRDDEPMLLEAGMCFAVHPAVVTRSVFAFVCDNVIVTEDGAHRLHATEQRVFSC